MPDLPTGVVTFLFTDIEGSTRLLQRYGDAYPAILEEHARRMREALAGHRGVEVSTEGDAFFAVFAEPMDGLAAAVDAQRALAEQRLPDSEGIKVRMGLHTGIGRLGGDSYAGIDVHRAARIAAAGHGGQVLVSDATRQLTGGQLPAGVEIRDLGAHRLKDLDEPQHVFQLVIPGLPGDFPALKSIRPGNLPSAPTTFVGRGDVVDSLRALVLRSPIVTLTGPGGTGKTRLSLELGHRLADEFGDGVFFVELETIREPELIPSAISRTLELAQKDGDIGAAIAEYLRDRRLLLILDNFEQVAAGARVVGDLATRGKESRIVVTSRAPLRLYGEQEFPVPPMRRPDPALLPALDELLAYECVRLFVERARAVQPAFELTPENAAAIVELCARLDGLPLAIELAAARVRLLSPDAILSRLGQRLDLLSSASVNVPMRQRSLTGAIEWSMELLDEPAQRLLERLSIFAGGASLTAIQAVCDPQADLFPEILDGLETLSNNSLIVPDPSGEEPRFAMLETIRTFGLSQLQGQAQLDELAASHAAWFADLVEGAENALRAGRGPELDWIGTEYANIQAALRWSIDTDEAIPGLRIVASVWRYWQRKGLLAEGRWWTQEVLNLPSAAPRTRERAAALGALGSLAYWMDDAVATRSGYEESLAIWREVGDELGIALGTYNLAFAHMLEGEGDVATTLIRDSKARFEGMGNSFWAGEATNSLGYTEILAGNLDEGEALVRSALLLMADDPLRMADNWTILAQVARMRGDFTAAREAVRSGLALLVHHRDATLTEGLAEVRALLEIAAGNSAWGLRLHAGAVAMRERIGGGPPMMMLGRETELADARAQLGEEEADRLIAEGRSLTEDEVAALAAAGVPAAADVASPRRG